MDLTANQLKTYNGKDGNKSYILYENVIYDVTHIFIDGEHRSCLAGNDLTGILEYMPHGTEVLKTVEPVGTIKYNKE